MRKKKKTGKLLSLFLVVAMLLSTAMSNVQTVNAAGNPYPKGRYEHSNCTWTAWELAKKETGVELPNWGNAKSWYDSARNAGYSVGTSPREKSIAVWTDSGTGHVAYVSAVKGNQIFVKEGNYNGEYHEGWVNAYGTRPYNQVMLGYIYLTPNTAQTAPTPQVEHGAPLSQGGKQSIMDGDYHIVCASNTSQCLDVADASDANGANIQIYNAVTYASQVFTVRYLGNGFYSIINKKTGKSLDVADGSTAIQTNVQQYAWNGTAGQQWAIHDSGDNASYMIQAKCSGYMLDMADGKTANGTNVQVYKKNGADAQKWLFIPWGPSVGRTVEDGTYQIAVSGSRNLVLSEAAGGKKALIEKNVNDERQAFNVKYAGDGYYHIINKKSGLYLDVVDASLKKRASVQMYKNNGNDAQKWIIKRSSSGVYNIISKCSGKYLDIPDATFVDGEKVWTFDGNGSSAQAWSFVKWTAPVRQPSSGSSQTGSGTGTGNNGTTGSSTGIGIGNNGTTDSGTGTGTGTTGNSTGNGTGTDGNGTGNSTGSGNGTTGNGAGTGTTGNGNGSGTGTGTTGNSTGSGTGTENTGTPGSGTGTGTGNNGTTGSGTGTGTGNNGVSGSGTGTGTGNNGTSGSGADNWTDNGTGTTGSGDANTNGNSSGNNTGNNVGSDKHGNGPSGLEIKPDPDTTGPFNFGGEMIDKPGVDGIDPEPGRKDEFYDVEWNVSSAVLKVGQATAKIIATASEDDDIDTYISSDENVAIVSEDGVIKGVGVGTAMIRAITVHECYADVTVKVQENTVTTKRISVKSKKVSLSVGRTYNLRAQADPITTSQRITYKSSNKKIVAVNSKGKIKAKKKGTAVIKVKSGKKTVKVKVTVK